MKRKYTTCLRAAAQIVLAALITAGLILITWSASPSSRRVLHVLTTGDVHGRWFDSCYVEPGVRNSLQNVSWYVDSVRNAAGEENVLLLDAGDILQGDNCTYYYNFVDTACVHPMARILKYMRYDAVAVGNHDIETGHRVYDRFSADMKRLGIQFLGGNALNASGDPYFPEYKLFRRAGMKVLVLGYTNANIKAWLTESLWSGMSFESLVPYVNSRVELLRAATKPDVVIVLMHSGTGDGDGRVLENQGLDLLDSVKGVDLVICGHDHRSRIIRRPGCCLVNGGSHASSIGHCTLTLEGNGAAKTVTADASLIKVNTDRVDGAMVKKFHPEYLAVKSFTERKVGSLTVPLYTRESYRGMCDYMNLIHTVQLMATGADVSFAAPLTYDGTINGGKVLYNDLFKIYPYENQLFKVRMTGRQIKDYLEYSYNLWIGGEDGHVLKIHKNPDERTGASGWSFDNRSYNFDSASGLLYHVDVFAPMGERVVIESFADGSDFDPEGSYTVAMTSYRASGGGGTIINGAGIPADELDGIVVDRYPEIRDLIYDFFKSNILVSSELTDDRELLGFWLFTGDGAAERIDADMKLLFD